MKHVGLSRSKEYHWLSRHTETTSNYISLWP